MRKSPLFRLLLSCLAVTCLNLSAPYPTYGVDPSSPDESTFLQDTSDDKKSSAELIEEAQSLLADDRPLDARTKLLRALEKDPKNYKVHMLLGGYYMIHVGHFRLALSYLNQSRKLFELDHGKPPYNDILVKDDHARILYLISETRLNLDNYKGALQALDEYSEYYSGSWYPGSRAWVLMKLGRVQEAVRVARLGILMGAEPGRTLNILGILLSMINQRQESLQVFDEAITYEYALGSGGQPATPLNNAGEVYREIFQEDRAEGSWLRAVSLPDGCEHVLPSLNLSNLFIEQLRFERADWSMNNFEDCIRQFPLRNGEEHRALVHMARGRVALHTGHIEEAVKHLEDATERQQWFGKIGTNPNDLRAATMLSLAQALRAENNVLQSEVYESFTTWLENQRKITTNAVRSWWLLRRTRQLLAEDLGDFEDLYIRNTDSMLEYHTLGDVLEGIPTSVLERRIDAERKADEREGARPYYKGYLAQNYLAQGKVTAARELLDETLLELRPGPDDGLKVHLLGLKLHSVDLHSSEYKSIAGEVFSLAPGELRNKGLRLPVRSNGLSPSVLEALSEGPFIIDNTANFTVSESNKSGKITLTLNSLDSTKTKVASGDNPVNVVNAFSRVVFQENF